MRRADPLLATWALKPVIIWKAVSLYHDLLYAYLYTEIMTYNINYKDLIISVEQLSAHR
jgi:hypothetical protein